MHHIKLCLATCLMISLSACSLIKLAEPPPLPLLPLAELTMVQGQPKVLKQAISVSIKDQQRDFILVTRFAQNELRLAALLSYGQPLFQAAYDGTHLSQQSFVDQDLGIARLLAEMQFARWPIASLQRHYPSTDGWELQVSETGTQWQRSLRWYNQPVLDITGQGSELLIHNHQLGYRVQVRDINE